MLTSWEQNLSPTPFKSWFLNDLISDLTEEFLELSLIAELHRVSHIPEAEIYVLGHHRRQEGGRDVPLWSPSWANRINGYFFSPI
ncbi:hypothetical protein NG799_08240 [Laspinema sp. D1]|uniref:Uncharacterized protein n=1 Tax=Laspinema palackyanum D2a TaxID=2953684 RepID=A0ABT2MS01_9CYAN|nr:hypothetical protein [Laspinema sp. D2a]